MLRLFRYASLQISDLRLRSIGHTVRLRRSPTRRLSFIGSSAVEIFFYIRAGEVQRAEVVDQVHAES
jgi:hypothetical protein